MFFNSPEKIEEFNLYQIGDLSCDKGYYGAKHDQICHEISFIVSGTGKFYGCGKYYPVERNMIFLNKKGEIHEILSDDSNPLRFLYIGFLFDEHARKDALLFEISELFNNLENPVIADTNDIYSVFMKITNEFIMRSPTGDYLISLYLKQMLVLIYRSFYAHNTKKYQDYYDTGNYKEIIHNIMVYIDSNFNYITNLSDISKYFGYSYGYLSQIFTKITGKTLKDYLYEKKFGHAVGLLKNNISITDIAEILGYNSIHAFSRAFKKYFSISPKEYKKHM